MTRRLLALLLALAAWTPSFAQGRSEDRPVFHLVAADLQVGEAAQPGAKSWNFEDEDEDVPTWAEDIRAQAPDLLTVPVTIHQN